MDIGGTRVAVIGAGVIGSSWAAHFLSRGCMVTVWDPGSDAQVRLNRSFETHWRWLSGRGVVGEQARDPPRLDEQLEGALRGAQFVQECAPEVLDIKRALYARMDAATSADVILASSSSGLTASAIQQSCRAPGRVIIGHPINPPHVLPLVEVVGGEATDGGTIERALAFYRGAAMHPILPKRELKGHIVNRLQAALWREMFSLVATGAASAADVDDAMRYALGPRWAAQGAFVALHLSGGQGGLRRVLQTLGPSIEGWWRDLGELQLTPELIERLVTSTDAVVADTSWEEMAARRDEVLGRVLAAGIGPVSVR